MLLFIFFKFVYLFFKEVVATTILLELQSSRPKVISPDATLSETCHVARSFQLPDIVSYVAQFFFLSQKRLSGDLTG